MRPCLLLLLLQAPAVVVVAFQREPSRQSGRGNKHGGEGATASLSAWQLFDAVWINSGWEQGQNHTGVDRRVNERAAGTLPLRGRLRRVRLAAPAHLGVDDTLVRPLTRFLPAGLQSG